VEISRSYVEGVRMDGQNVHSNYVFVRERISDTELIVEMCIPPMMCVFPAVRI